jgi:hypothetical protein
MAYAKSRVAPPTVLKQVNQYSNDIAKSVSDLEGYNSSFQDDSIFERTIDKIRIFSRENKFSQSDADNSLDRLVGSYVPLFLDQSFSKFKLSEWNDNDHSYMLSQASRLEALRHSDNSLVVRQSAIDSLNLISKIIVDYRNARRISRISSFTGIASARTVINEAKSYAHNKYLSNCTSLVYGLKSVRSRIGQSHYLHISAQVGKMANYGNYTRDFYENTLIPQVDAAISEYNKNATALYGSKKSVTDLYNRARHYYDQAMSYYGNN